MKYSVKQMAKLAGITSKTLRHYDKIGLLSPAKRGENNYRYYESADIEKLQQIMFYKELDFSLKQIKVILKDKNFDIEKSLDSQVLLLKGKITRLNEILALAQKTLKNMKENTIMSEKEKFEAFKQKMITENDIKYGEEAKQKYGKSYDDSIKKLSGLNAEEYKKLQDLTTEVNNQFMVAFSTKNIKGDESKNAVELHKKLIKIYWTDFCNEAYRGLAETYVDDKRFAKYYDDIADGLAQFVRDAIFEHTKD